MFPLLKKASMMLGAAGIVGVMAVPIAVVPGETISLWNFNEANGPTVADQVAPAMDGEASPNVQIVSGSVLGAGFGSARDFSVLGSFINIGEVCNSKLDLKLMSEASVEAVVYRTGNAVSPVVIFDNRQIQLQIINNRPAAFIRQSSGFKGVVSTRTLALNTAYRIGAHMKSGFLVVSLDGKVVGSVKVMEPIQPVEPGIFGYIGGNVNSMNFPGIIDDVRVSNTAGLDTVVPEIQLVSPDLSVPTVQEKPNFVFSLTDNEDQIDEGSIVVKVNGEVATGWVFDDSTFLLSGSLSIPLVAGKKNYISVSVADNVGNLTEVAFEARFIKWGSGEEYQSDSHTLGLWHFNEYGNSWVKDSSSFGRHARVKGTQSVQGVLGNARLIDSLESIIAPPTPIPGAVFTFEAWVNPISSVNNANIFDNDQIEIFRGESGAVTAKLITPYNSFYYETDPGVLPQGKFSHVKVVYDGNRSSQNLLILIDGLVVSSFDAVPGCEFDDEPKLTTFGRGGTLVIDEVRLSSAVRDSVNLIRGSAPNIEIGVPSNLSTVRDPKLNFYAKMTDLGGVSPNKVEIKLNNVIQVPNVNFTVTSSEIKGTLPSLLSPGMNDIEVRVTGNSGNQTVLNTRVFYIADNGLSEYSTDAGTVALWHLNESSNSTTLADSSGNNHHLTAPYANSNTAQNGIFGNSQHIDNFFDYDDLVFSGRNFTVESWIMPGNYNSGNMLSMSSNYFSLTLSRNGHDFDVSVNIPGGNSTVGKIVGAIPTGKYNHFAIVHDSEATSGNLQILVNGIVRYQRDVKSVCNTCMSPIDFSISSPNFFDEIRLSNVARKSFNVGGGDGPTIGFIGLQPSGTVHVSQPLLNVVFADNNSIDQSTMAIEVNGVNDPGLSKFVSGTTGNLTGPLSINLNNGANQITVRAKNQLGRESVQNFMLYYITKGSPTEYAVNPNTMGLWHFNSGSPGILADSTQRAFNITNVNPITTLGVYGEGLKVDYGNMYANASPAPQSQNWTFEVWMRPWGSMSFNQYIDSNHVLSIDMYGRATLGSSNQTTWAVVPYDNKYHHVAVIRDTQNPYKQLLLVVDGKVVEATAESNNMSFDFESMSGSWGYLFLDEMRVSSAAEYTLSFERPVTSTLFQNIRAKKNK